MKKRFIDWKFYFRIPTGQTRKVVRKVWIQKLRNVRANLILSNNTRVCSSHFEPEDFKDTHDLHHDAVPTKFPSKPVIIEKTPRKNPLDRFRESCSSEIKSVSESDITETDMSSESCIENLSNQPDHDRCVSVETQTVIHQTFQCQHCSNDLPVFVDVGCQCVLPDINVRDLKSDDKKTRFFTGFVNFGTFLVIMNALMKHAGDRLNYWDGEESLSNKKYHNLGRTKPGPKRQLCMETEFLMTMMWYRLGLLQEHLASIFKVSVSSVSRILTTWTQFIYEHSTSLVYLPLREQVLVNMPSHFINHQNVYIIYDCTEFFIEKPSGLEAQAVTWSEYKHHCTIKSLIGVSPTGMTTYVSRAWGGRASDRHIVKNENILESIPEGMAVMADKGFEVEDLAPSGIEIIIPPKVSSKGQMSDFEFFKTVDIAEPRIVVEMKMEQAKNYQILQSVIPISRIATAEQVIFNCFAFTNLLPPLFVPATAAHTSVNLPLYNANLNV